MSSDEYNVDVMRDARLRYPYDRSLQLAYFEEHAFAGDSSAEAVSQVPRGIGLDLYTAHVKRWKVVGTPHWLDRGYFWKTLQRRKVAEVDFRWIDGAGPPILAVILTLFLFRPAAEKTALPSSAIFFVIACCPLKKQKRNTLKGDV
jgi:hypothetical protein